jgi:competence protein ComEC
VRRNLEPIRARENGQPAAILASLLVGDYARLNASTRETFQNCGTFHVLVVSGLHVVWIAGLLLQFFRLIRIPERTRLFLVALVILFYTCIVGFQASITRCLWMFVLYLIGRSILRHADPVNVLLSSALLLLAAQPDWLFETGFQLSFLSVTAIAMMAVPAIESYLKPLFAPLRNCGNPDRLFLKPGRWQRWGRSLRTRCEIRIEETTDRLPRAFSSILFRITRGFAGAALAVGSIVVVSLSIQLWIEPILACNFNRISWIAVLANLFIVPFSSLVLAAGIVTVLAGVLPCFGPSLVHIAGTLSSLLLRWAGDLAAVSGAWQRCPTPSAAWISGGILLLFVWSYFRWRRIWIPCTYAVVLLACVSQGSLPIIGILIDGGKSILCRRNVEFWPKHRPVLSFTFLDVGQGDSIFIRFPDKRAWLVDAGGLLQGPSREEGAYAFDLGEAVVSRYLWHSWISRLDRLVLSHTDLDHAGGARSVLRNFQVDRIDHPLAVPDRVLSGIADIARQTGAWLHRGAAGASEKIGPVTVEILHPSAKPVSGAANENSLVLRFSFGRFSALLTGDLGKNGEFDMLSRSKTLPGLLLKVAHHGSRFGTSSAFLDAVQPRWAIVSVGRHNPHGHPSPEVLRRLLQHGSGFYLTFDHGAITFETDGSLYRIRSHLNGVLGKGAL